MLTLDRPLTVIDLEATDLDPERARIIQVAARRIEPGESPHSDSALHGAQPRDHHLYTQTVNPGIPVPKDIQQLTGLSQEQITAEGKPWASVADALAPLLADADLAGYNLARYDLPLLEAEYHRLDRELPGPDDRKIIDAYALEKALNPRTLENVYARYTGDAHDRPHNAAADVEATWRVLLGQCMNHDLIGASPSDLAQQAHRNALPLTHQRLREKEAIVLCFGKYEGKTLRWVIENDPDYVSWMHQTIDDVPEELGTLLQTQPPPSRRTANVHGMKDKPPQTTP